MIIFVVDDYVCKYTIKRNIDPHILFFNCSIFYYVLLALLFTNAPIQVIFHSYFKQFLSISAPLYSQASKKREREKKRVIPECYEHTYTKERKPIME